MTDVIKRTEETNIFGYTILFIISVILCSLPSTLCKKEIRMSAASFSFVISLTILYLSIQTTEYFFILYFTLILTVSLKQFLTSFFEIPITDGK